MKNLMQIGEVANLFHISVGTLRHYESIGLIQPEYTDEKTGYRYYSTRQFEVLNTIRYLRVLDMPLDEIAGFLQNRDIDIIEKKLKNQRDTVRQKIHRLKTIEKKIDNRLLRINEAQNCDLNIIIEVNSPPIRIAVINRSVRLDSSLELENPIRTLERNQNETVVFLGKVGVGISKEHMQDKIFDKYDRVFLMLDNEDEFAGDVEILPAGGYIKIYFRGSHEKSPEYYRILIDYANKNNLDIRGYSLETTLIDYGITNDIDKYVTEIMVPVGD